MKKGISLIVLVITIIVMIIIAGAIIISLSQNNIVTQATKAKTDANLANARAVIVAKWADSAVANEDEPGTSELEDSDYYQALADAKLATDAADAAAKYVVVVPTNGGCPSVATVTATPSNP